MIGNWSHSYYDQFDAEVDSIYKVVSYDDLDDESNIEWPLEDPSEPSSKYDDLDDESEEWPLENPYYREGN